MELNKKSFYFENGEPGILLLHGLTGSPSEMYELGRFLSDKGFTVLCPLLPGHSTTPEDLNNRKWQEWYISAIESLATLKNKCKKVFACGLSLGGSISLHLAAHYKLEGVIILAAPVKFSQKKLLFFISITRKFIKCKKKKKNPEGLTERFSYNCYPLNSIFEMNKFLNHLYDDLPDIQTPLLLIYSKKDRD